MTVNPAVAPSQIKLTNPMKKYQITQTVRAIKARDLRVKYVDPNDSIPTEFLLAKNDGRLKFHSKVIKFNEHIIEPDDYIVICEDGDIVPVAATFFKERFEEI